MSTNKDRKTVIDLSIAFTSGQEMIEMELKPETARQMLRGWAVLLDARLEPIDEDCYRVVSDRSGLVAVAHLERKSA